MSGLVFRAVNAVSGPKPLGAYSSAVQVGLTLYLSGMLGIDKDSGKLVSGGVAAEAKQTFANIGAVLEEMGSSFNKVVSAKIYLDNFSDSPIVNEIYQQYFKPPYPARCMMEVSKLPLGAKLEVEIIAVVADQCRL